MDSRKLLYDGAAEIGIELDGGKMEQFETYYRLLIEWNEKMNLTSITDEREVVQKHFLDSLLIARHLDFSAIESVIDIGTGAGFPGIPLKIAFPHLKVTLLDTLKKRILYLETVVEILGLDDVTCVHARAEDAAKDSKMRETFDLAVSRAVSRLNTLSEYCIPFVSVGGSFIAFKSSNAAEEIEEAKGAIEILGGNSSEVYESFIPGTDISRQFVRIEKGSATPVKYPRKAGKPAKSPL